MDLDGLTNQGESETGTTILGCEISFPYLLEVLGGDPWARVSDLHADSGILVPYPGLDEPSLSRRIHGIQKEISKAAEKGLVVPQDQRELRRCVAAEFGSPALMLPGEAHHEFGDIDL